jgi:periplasmic protein TonB
MFEQTLLTHAASARKTGALAASFLAQTAVVGVLLVGPLLYTQTLTWVPAIEGLVFAPPKPLVIEPVPTTQSPTTSSAGSLYRQFLAPLRVPTATIRTGVIDAELLSDPNLDAVTVGIADTGPSLLPTIIGPAPPVEVTKPLSTNLVSEEKPLRVSGGTQAAKVLTRVLPKYPALALQMHLSGSVHLVGIIAKDGRIRDLRVLDGPPMLRQAALDAVSQWTYSPTYLSGQPVEVEAPIEVNFALR